MNEHEQFDQLLAQSVGAEGLQVTLQPGLKDGQVVWSAIVTAGPLWRDDDRSSEPSYPQGVARNMPSQLAALRTAVDHCKERMT